MLMSGIWNIHLRLSIEKCQPTFIDDLLEYIDKNIALKESDMIFKYLDSLMAK